MRRYGLYAALLLAGYWVMAVSVSPHFSTTADEIAHLTAGTSYWLTNDYRLQPENGNLPQRWASLPAVLSGARFPTLNQHAWIISDVWEMGFQFFYKLGNNLAALLLFGRAMIALFGVALGWLVWRWARGLWGDGGGLLSLALFAFCPTMLAHGALITSDMTLAFFLLATLTAWWRWLHRPTPFNFVLTCLSCGGLFLAKFSAVLVLPMVALLAAVRLLSPAPLELIWPRPLTLTNRGAQLAAMCAHAALVGLATFAIVWAAYGFRYESFNHYEPGRVRPLVGWDMLLDRPGLVPSGVEFARAHRILPEAWIYGFAHSWRFAQHRPAFLNGESRKTGWLAYFPYAVLVKTPLPLFGLLGLALAAIAAGRLTPSSRPGLLAALRHPGSLLYRTAPLWILFTLYGVFALTSHLNIGHRHVLPMYPVLFILAGATVRWWSPATKLTAGLCLALLLWFVGESLAIRPDYLSYFNEVIGGPRNAYRHLIDSNLDWGQDLPALRVWLDEHGLAEEHSGRLYLSYFGSGDPEFYGIHAIRVADNFFDLRPRVFPAQLRGGLYCISATMFQRVYTLAPGPWSAVQETQYRERLALVTDSHARPTLQQTTEFEHLEFGRLCAWLKQRTPDAEAGYSILIFHLSDSEIDQALFGPPPGP